jgi:methionyl-tRNA synthetase
MVLTWKYFDGKVPSAKEIEPTTEKREKILKQYNDTHNNLNTSIEEMNRALEEFRFRDAQFQMMNLARLGNKFLADAEPWKLAKEDMEAVAGILNYSLMVVGNIAFACQPFLPDASLSILEQLNIDSNDSKKFWNSAELIEPLKERHQLNQPELLYRNVEDEDIARQVEKLQSVKKKKMEAAQESIALKPIKETIVFDDFAKIDIRIGRVLAAEKMEKSDKLLKLTIESGVDTRTILSGIAKHYTPEEMVGKQVTFVANLAPRKMMGIESQGMILMAEDAQGKLRLVLPDNEVNAGATVA